MCHTLIANLEREKLMDFFFKKSIPINWDDKLQEVSMSFWQKMKIVMSGIWSFLEPFVKIFVSKIGATLASSAMQAVTAVSQYAIDNDEDKRQKAFNIIVSDLKGKGIQVGVDVTTSMINSAIECAVQRLKSGDK